MAKKPPPDQLLSEINDLKEKIKLYQSLVDNSPDLFYRTDIQGRVTYVSPTIYQLSGYSVEEAIGKDMAEDGYLYPEQRQVFLEKLSKTGQVTNFEAQLKHKDGSVYWVSTNAHFFRDKAGNVVGVEGVSRNISELKAAEEALRKSEERFRLAFHTSPDSITLSKASDALIIDINEGFTKIMGYTRQDVVGKASLDLKIWKRPSDRKRLVANLSKHGCVENLEAEFIAKDGTIRTGLMSARPLTIDDQDCILLITRDITEHKQLEQQLHQANKFQALGTLAGGIAHNFNNLLMGIQGHASLIKTDFAGHPELMERIHGIELCVQSAACLTKQLLGLARDGKYEIKAVDLNELLLNTANMFAQTHQWINFHTTLHHKPIIVNVDKNQIEQVLLNLFANARQAMPDGGEIYLKTAISSLSGAYCESQQIEEGDYCMISVADTGYGMDEKTRQRVFDPFFTTKEKETDRGTGLGLASAYGIVRNHGGTIHVISELNCGATFSIYLPLSTEKAIQEPGIKDKLIRRSGTILLVDDETIVLNVAKAMLEKLGYDVLLSKNGRQAVEMVVQKRDIIDLVILDLSMPGMDGGKTFDQIREIQPNMPVILSSGYPLGEHAISILNRGCNGFLQKPFNLSIISHKIRQVLGESKNRVSN
jgi:PAS domain S-box-containing protein